MKAADYQLLSKSFCGPGGSLLNAFMEYHRGLNISVLVNYKKWV